MADYRISDQAKAQLLAAASLSTSPDSLRWDNGAWVGADESDPSQVKTIEEDAAATEYRYRALCCTVRASSEAGA